MTMRTELQVRSDLMELTAKEVNLLARGLASLKDQTDYDIGEEKTLNVLFDQLCEIENLLINVGEL